MIDVDKRVVPKLLSALEKPGCSDHIYPSMLPFISKLSRANLSNCSSPEEVVKCTEFYKQLLSSFRKGAEQQLGFASITHSSDDSSSAAAIKKSGKRDSSIVASNFLVKQAVNAYFECAIYGLRQTTRNQSDANTFLNKDDNESETLSVTSEVIFLQVTYSGLGFGLGVGIWVWFQPSMPVLL